MKSLANSNLNGISNAQCLDRFYHPNRRKGSKGVRYYQRHANTFQLKNAPTHSEKQYFRNIAWNVTRSLLIPVLVPVFPAPRCGGSRNKAERAVRPSHSAGCPSRLGMRVSGPANPKGVQPAASLAPARKQKPVQGRQSVQRSRRLPVGRCGSAYIETRFEILSCTSSSASLRANSSSW